jgi:small conductance mechanosensitive channel
LSNSNITNYTEMGIRRTWFNICVFYGADLKQVKDILMQVVSGSALVHKDPAPQIVVTELGDSAVNISVRVTTSNENFWAMQEQLFIDCKAVLNTAGIEIPFPQRKVYVHTK